LEVRGLALAAVVTDDWRPDTRAIRSGIDRSHHAETSEGLFLTSGYVYETAADAEAAFAGQTDRYMYSRFGNPTVTALADRLCAIEGAEACFPTASGMAGVFYSLLALVKAGDRIVSSRNLFGSCFNVVAEILPQYGITTDLVDGTDLDQWAEALKTPAKAVFFESPSNPMLEIVDIAAVCELAHAAGAVVVADNAMAGPATQRPTEYGADVVVYSTTKHIDGQGRTLGGAIMGSKEFINGPVKTLIRNTGPTMSPFTAWTAIKGLETLRMRTEASAASALQVAEFLYADPRVAEARYPWLPSHPQYDLARAQMNSGGTIVTCTVDGGKERAFAVIDKLRLFDISNNFGDAKSLVTHPATTTHQKLGPEGRAKVGISDGTIRLSIGLEDPADLLADLDQALHQRLRRP
jgi:O-succinylhomoserine sulfhydrylase